VVEEPPEELEPPVDLLPPVDGVPPAAIAPPVLRTPPVAFAPPVAVVPPAVVAPPVLGTPPVDFAPPVAFAPPVPGDPPVPGEPPTPVLPEPTNDVTLDASKDVDRVLFEAVTVPSLARLLLEDVVYLANEVIDEPGIEIESVLAELFVFTTTTTTDVSLLYAERDNPDAGLAVASTR
jgi:hypothetical protein